MGVYGVPNTTGFHFAGTAVRDNYGQPEWLSFGAASNSLPGWSINWVKPPLPKVKPPALVRGGFSLVNNLQAVGPSLPTCPPR